MRNLDLATINTHNELANKLRDAMFLRTMKWFAVDSVPGHDEVIPPITAESLREVLREIRDISRRPLSPLLLPESMYDNLRGWADDSLRD